MNCNSCNINVGARKNYVKFKCPNCNNFEIIRCDICRNFGKEYVCKECGFIGP